MKNVIFALLFSHSVFALNLHSVSVTPLSAQSINVALNTEATELYYFDTWNYSISGNIITLNVFFIEGFGSTIAYLNNNFQLSVAPGQSYTLYVRIFYTDVDHTFKTLKDQTRLTFRMPSRRYFPEYLRTVFQSRERP